MERLGRHERTLLALEILKAYSCKPHSSPLTQNATKEKRAELVNAARTVLLERAKAVIKELLDLNFNNKEISYGIGFDPGIVSRAFNNSHEVRLGLPKLKKLVESLELFSVQARLKLFHRLVLASPVSLNVLDFCATSSLVNPETTSTIRETVFASLFAALTNNLEVRVPLPDHIGGAVVLVGPPDLGFYFVQIEGTSDIERLKNQIHEFRHILQRKEDELRRKEREMGITSSSLRSSENRPKSAF